MAIGLLKIRKKIIIFFNPGHANILKKGKSTT